MPFVCWLVLITFLGGFLHGRVATLVQGGYQSEETRGTGVHNVRFLKNYAIKYVAQRKQNDMSK